MIIAVNTRLLIRDKLDGIGWFCYETCRRMVKNHPEHDFYFLFDRDYDRSFIFEDNVTAVVLPPPARHPVLWFLWLELSVNRFLKKINADLFISPDGFVPLGTKTPCLPVIHDINFHHRPEDLPLFSRKYYNFFFPRFAKKARRIGTVSKYSAKDIAESYGVCPDRVDVFYNGVNSSYVALDERVKRGTMEEYSHGYPYFCFVGTLHPRKNIANLLYAWDEFRKKSEKRVKMAIVGEKFFLTKDIEEALKSLSHKDDVIFTGRLHPEKLHKVVGSSLALTFVPHFEGFGIPVAEAMRCGVPVLTSNVTSLPEVGGDAVLYTSPEDIEDIAENMKKLAEDSKLRETLIKKGFEQVKQFNWDFTAAGLWASAARILYDAE